MIKLIILDVDGTLTKGGILIGNSGEEFKEFNVKDGYMIASARKKCGKIFAIITGRNSKIVSIRAKELGITHFYQGIDDKIVIYEQLKKELNITDEETAYIGDDLNDFEVMKRVGLVGAPADACREILETADFVSSKNGGEGAVREFIENILKKENSWNKIVQSN